MPQLQSNGVGHHHSQPLKSRVRSSKEREEGARGASEVYDRISTGQGRKKEERRFVST